VGIVHALIGCFLGVATYLVLVVIHVPVDGHGEWSIGLIVALCFMWTWGIGYAPAWWASRKVG
jgi:hypothetical protein